MIKEFSLKKPTEIRWEKYRDEFLKSVQKIYEKETTMPDRLERGNDDGADSVAGSVPITTPLNEMALDGLSTVLLAYASRDPGGQIVVMNISGLGINHGETMNEVV